MKKLGALAFSVLVLAGALVYYLRFRNQAAEKIRAENATRALDDLSELAGRCAFLMNGLNSAWVSEYAASSWLELPFNRALRADIEHRLEQNSFADFTGPNLAYLAEVRSACQLALEPIALSRLTFAQARSEAVSALVRTETHAKAPHYEYVERRLEVLSALEQIEANPLGNTELIHPTLKLARELQARNPTQEISSAVSKLEALASEFEDHFDRRAEQSRVDELQAKLVTVREARNKEMNPAFIDAYDKQIAALEAELAAAEIAR